MINVVCSDLVFCFKAQGSPLFVDGVAELEVSSTGLKGEGLGVAGMPVAGR